MFIPKGYARPEFPKESNSNDLPIWTHWVVAIHTQFLNSKWNFGVHIILTYDFLEPHSFCSVQSKYLIKILSPLHFTTDQLSSGPIKTPIPEPGPSGSSGPTVKQSVVLLNFIALYLPCRFISSFDFLKVKKYTMCQVWFSSIFSYFDLCLITNRLLQSTSFNNAYKWYYLCYRQFYRRSIQKC